VSIVAMLRIVLCVSLVACATGSGPSGGGDDTGGGSGGTGGLGGTGGTGGSGTDAGCPAVNFTASTTTPSVQFLIDRSLSMGYTLDTSSGSSRYQVVGSAVLQIAGQLQGKAYFGASLFTQTNTVCPRVDSTPARQLNNQSQIQTLLGAFTPTGFTPMAAAVGAVQTQFATNPPPEGSPPILVLATDGLPNNCNYNGDPNADTVAAITAAYDAGIRTYVLGIAGVDTTYLQDMANAGQGLTNGLHNAAFYTASNPQDLQTALQTIIGGVTSCELMISGHVYPDYASQGVVTLDGNELHYGTDWILHGDNVLVLTGPACTKLETEPNAHVQATFPCGAVIQ
jgi:hypothetical protein